MLILCLGFFVGANAFALSSDQNKSAFFRANSAICKRAAADDICVYSGEVKYAQGTTKLDAPEVTVHKQNGKIAKIVAVGKRAHYVTTLDTKDTKNAKAKIADAKANSITINQEKKLMILEGDGEITDGQNQFSGPYIEYNLLHKTIFSTPSETAHTKIVIYPDNAK